MQGEPGPPKWPVAYRPPAGTAGVEGGEAALDLGNAALGPEGDAANPAFSVDPQASWPGEPSRARRPRFHLHSLGNGLIVTLVAAGPVLLLEANWRGAPLTRQPHGAWVLALLVVGGAFFAGGALAGRHRRRRDGAVVQGLALSGLACAALAVAGGFRELMLFGGFPTAVTVGWLVLGAVVATGLACAGGLFGRSVYIRSRKKRRAEQHWRAVQPH